MIIITRAGSLFVNRMPKETKYNGTNFTQIGTNVNRNERSFKDRSLKDTIFLGKGYLGEGGRWGCNFTALQRGCRGEEKINTYMLPGSAKSEMRKTVFSNSNSAV